MHSIRLFTLPVTWLLCFSFPLTLPTVAFAAKPSPLVLQKALVLHWSAALEPSGLAYCQGQLLMIADNQDQHIFEIHPEAEEDQRVTVYKTLENIPSAPQAPLPWSILLEQQFSALFSQKTYDWEAISCDDQAKIWLASERFIALLKVSQQGDLSWLETDIYTKGHAAGLFQVNNGFIEGMAWQAPNRLFIAAERQERGILVAEIKNQTQAEISQVQALPASALAEQAKRSADFSDLWLEADALYTLERNHFAVCRRTLTSYEVERCWSYDAIENSADYRYPENNYGIAEGLARIGKQLFIVVDNNQKKRLKTGQTDAMLFIYNLPEDW